MDERDDNRRTRELEAALRILALTIAESAGPGDQGRAIARLERTLAASDGETALGAAAALEALQAAVADRSGSAARAILREAAG